VVCVKGRLDTRDDVPKIVAQDITVLDVADAAAAPPLKLGFPAHALDEATVARLKKLLQEHPGESPVFVTIGEQTVRLSAEFDVDETNGLRALLMEAFGPDVVRA